VRRRFAALRAVCQRLTSQCTRKASHIHRPGLRARFSRRGPTLSTLGWTGMTAGEQLVASWLPSQRGLSPLVDERAVRVVIDGLAA
jgi:hypothetical protein